MRLIDADALHGSLGDHAEGKSDFYRGAIYTAIMFVDDAPSVPAVPLDKLCEWLEENARLVRPDGSRWDCDWMQWKKELTKWMEGQHEQDQ